MLEKNLLHASLNRQKCIWDSFRDNCIYIDQNAGHLVYTSIAVQSFKATFFSRDDLNRRERQNSRYFSTWPVARHGSRSRDIGQARVAHRAREMLFCSAGIDIGGGWRGDRELSLFLTRSLLLASSLGLSHVTEPWSAACQLVTTTVRACPLGEPTTEKEESRARPR